MKSIVIDIYNEYFDWHIAEVKEFKHIFSGVYQLYDGSLDIEAEITRVIMTTKGDGVQILTSFLDNVIYMKVILFFTSDDIEKEYDINYIQDFLNAVGIAKKGTLFAHVEMATGYIIIDDVWGDEVEKILEVLNETGITEFNVTRHANAYHRGASNRIETILLGIVSGVSVEVLKYLGMKISQKLEKEKVPDVGVLDVEQVKKNLSLLTDQNIAEAFILKFEKLDEEKFSLTLTTRYDLVNCKCNSRCEIESFEIQPFTQTRI